MKAVLYGAGRRLEDFFGQCLYLKYLDILFIADKDRSKWGKNYFGYEVCPPDRLKEREWEKVLVIPDAFPDIYKQLHREYGFEETDMMRPEELIVPETCNLGSIELACKQDDAYDIRDIVPSKVIAHNRLEQFFFFEKHRIIWKWWHYFEIYHRHFEKYTGKSVRVLEIGVYKGGSLQMWKDYFGSGARIVGIDIDPACKGYEEEHINVCIGSQEDEAFLKKVSDLYGPFDIIIDDGGHQVRHQIKSFEVLFPLLEFGGVYLVEDIHSSYWPDFGGMPYKPGSYIEYSKNFIDCLHLQHMGQEFHSVMPEYAGDIGACHYYDSVLVVDKKFRGRSLTTMSGENVG